NRYSRLVDVGGRQRLAVPGLFFCSHGTTDTIVNLKKTDTTAQILLERALEFLRQDPLAETRNMKSLRPNSVAGRELRLLGKYRVLFSVDAPAERVTIILVGEKRGDKLLVLGKEFGEYHESDPTEQS